MTSSKILYGTRDGKFWHIDDVERGLACLCKCPVCNRRLIAKKGEVLDHHFSHESDDVNCNPQPESLTHLYAKQQVANLSELILPRFDVEAEVRSTDGERHEVHWHYVFGYRLRVKSAAVEAYLEDVKPDVVFTTEIAPVAAEVYVRHQVPPEKIAKFQSMHRSAVEIDLSDLPLDASARVVNAAIVDLRRWRWLHNQHQEYERTIIFQLLCRSTKIYVPKPPQDVPNLLPKKIPSRKMENADKLAARAKVLIEQLLKKSMQDRLSCVRELDAELRLALNCTQIGILPTRLPAHLMQTVDGQSALGMHPVTWQTGVFAKFCMQGNTFSVKEVESWVRASYKDKALDSLSSVTQTSNFFSPVAEALYHFLRNLSAQGLLRESKANKPWSSVFSPVDSTKALMLERLLNLPAALDQLAK